MRRVVWSPGARSELLAIRDYVRAFNVSAARKLAERLIEAAGNLTEHADRGRIVRGSVRELVTVRPYIIRYEIADEEVRILTIRHSARQPEQEPPPSTRAS